MSMTRNELIESNMRLVYFIINTYYPTYSGNEDVIQTGMVGLCRAADLYDPEKGAFSTIASKFIRNEISSYVRKDICPVQCLSIDYMGVDDDDLNFQDVVPAEAVDFDINLSFKGFFNQLSDRDKMILRDLHSGMTQTDIAKKLNLTINWVNKIVRKLRRQWRRYNGED